MLDILKRIIKPSSHHTSKSEEGLLNSFRKVLGRTRSLFSDGLLQLIRKKNIDEAFLETLETLLLSSDFGVEMTDTLINWVREHHKKNSALTGEALIRDLKKHLVNMLNVLPLGQTEMSKPHLILMVGVNGSGKTTTIGKLAKLYKSQELNVLLAAGDTFRAAAIEQLQTWGEREKISVIAQHHGADSASVIFDAYQAAKSRHMDILIADTAGRLHTQTGLMEELKKVVKVVRKIDETAPQDIWLVIDASIGQNALVQAQKFHEALSLTGLIITKLDGTAKGGALFNIVKKLQIPILYIGTGETSDDLAGFDPDLYVEALFS